MKRIIQAASLLFVCPASGAFVPRTFAGTDAALGTLSPRTAGAVAATTAAKKVVAASSSSADGNAVKSDNDEAMDRIKSEYRRLQEQLLRNFLREDDGALGEEADEDKLEDALHRATFYKVKELDDAARADCELEHAHGDYERAHVERELAHRDVENAERQAAMSVKSVDGTRRGQFLRDLDGVKRKARREELDARKAELTAQLAEVDAEIRRDEALVLLRQLEGKERDLKAALEEAHHHHASSGKKNTEGGEAARQQLVDEHEAFLEKVRDNILVQHDATKGYEL